MILLTPCLWLFLKWCSFVPPVVKHGRNNSIYEIPCIYTYNGQRESFWLTYKNTTVCFCYMFLGSWSWNGVLLHTQVWITPYKKYQAFIPIMANVSHFDSLIKMHTTVCFCYYVFGLMKLKWCCFASPVVKHVMNNSI